MIASRPHCRQAWYWLGVRLRYRGGGWVGGFGLALRNENMAVS